MKLQHKEISMSNIPGGTRTENVYGTESKKQAAESHVTIDVTVRVNYRAPPDDAGYLHKRVSCAVADMLDSEHLPEPAPGGVKSSAALVSVVAEVVKPAKPALTEDEIAAYYRGRIEDGNLSLEDIPRIMARIGLSKPSEFVDEMEERMGIDNDEAYKP
jgi:hypothetical protein